MSSPKRRSLRKSDIWYGAGFVVILYLVICYGIAISNYDLDWHVRQEIRIAGTVSTEDESLPDFGFTYQDSDGNGGSFVGLHTYAPGSCDEDEEEENPSIVEYDTLILFGLSWANQHGVGGAQPPDHLAKLAVRLSLDMPAGWHAQPPDHFIEGPASQIDFLLSRNSP